jgi:deoxyribodipyrimidine photo-lyase
MDALGGTVAELAGIGSRQAVAAAMRSVFPGLAVEDVALSPILGGRVAGLEALGRVAPGAYERTRNFLDGRVTRLSPYLRHGVVTLAEVRDHVLAVEGPARAGKLVNELGWRDYWQRLYAELGKGIWQDREAYKTGWAARAYGSDLPPELVAGTTGLACMDGFSRDLRETGYLHNHMRMWMAAYVVHFLKIRWQAGARWFLEHLVDGDPGSNNLSWQWVASTFASKPYIFNRENLERYSGGIYCRTCSRAGSCPFDESYEVLTERLFRVDSGMPAPVARGGLVELKPTAAGVGRPLVWVHTDSLNPAMGALRNGADAVFCWDREWVETEKISLKRLVFLAECLAEMPKGTRVAVGDVAAEVLRAADEVGAAYVVAQRTPDPRLLAAAAKMERVMPVVWVDAPAFVSGRKPYDLKRFSRYWQKAQTSAMQPTAGAGLFGHEE